MELLTASDVLLLQTGAITASAYAASLLWNLRPKSVTKPDLPLLQAAKLAKPNPFQPTRSILKVLEQSRKECIVFYGSQTGTAERFASRFAKEALARYGLSCVTADLDDYDFNDLAKLTEKHLVVFIIATYGEGEPTDSAIPFQKYLDGLKDSESLERLRYSAFGLGSTSYTHYNAMIRRVDGVLSTQNAVRVGELGFGDDGKGTLEEDFVEWMSVTLTAISTSYGLDQVIYQYKPSFDVVESTGHETIPRNVFLGESNKAQLVGRVRGPFTSSNPYPAPVVAVQELFGSSDRNCLRLEFDTTGTSIQYDTGDHLAVWPVNSDAEVDLFLTCFGLIGNRATIIDITPTDPSTKLPIPARTTYEAAVRYYLDVGAVVTRQMIQHISSFAVSELVQQRLNELVEDKDAYSNMVVRRRLTISQLLSDICTNIRLDSSSPVVEPPFSLILETIPKLRQRHYSISSSSLVSPRRISITAVIDSVQDLAQGIDFRGVSTGYLSALKTDNQSNISSPPQPTTHILKLPRQSSNQMSLARIHVRPSKFRPPFLPSVPIVMIGPGTGVAPFLAFVQERALQYSRGRKVGQTLLFYGCRSAEEDFLYRETWDELLQNNSLGEGAFSMFTAFSRQPGMEKAYVQNRLKEQSQLLIDLIGSQGAHVYICGNASKMAKDVSKTFAAMLGNGQDTENLTLGFSRIDELKKAGRWSEDVW